MTSHADWMNEGLGIHPGPFHFAPHGSAGQTVDVAFDGRYIVPPAMSYRGQGLI